MEYEKEVIAMDVRINDVLEMKKNHPCGSHTFTVLRIGMDFRLRCDVCGHEIMISRQKAEKGLKKIIKVNGDNNV